jgi:hypothetical protein
MKRRFVLASLALLCAAAFAHADQGNPKLKSIEAIRFGPNGLLLIGAGSDVVTVETGDTKETSWTKTDLANFDQLLAGKLGLKAKDIEIKRIAVNPASRKLYVAVRSLKGNQYAILTVDGAGKVDEFSLENVKFMRYPLAVGEKAVSSITDLTWAGGKIVAATDAGTTFGSRVFTIHPDKGASSFSTETYHVGHGKWETKAPIRCLMPYEDGSKTNVVGSFQCTPIVKYSLDDTQDDVKVKGVSVVELGTGNQPLSMFPYEKDGKRYILVNVFRKFNQNPVGPSPNWVAKVDFELLKETTNVNEKALWRVDKKGKASVSVTDRAVVAQEYFGVQHMDKLDESRALVLRNTDKNGLGLRILQLP